MAKEQVSFRIDDSVVKRARNAVRHHRGAPNFLTLDGFVEEALSDAVHRLEKRHNGGRAYGTPSKRVRADTEGEE